MGEGDSTQSEVAVTADPSLGTVPSLLCDGWVLPSVGPLRSWRRGESLDPPRLLLRPAMLPCAPAQRGCGTALCRI